MYNLKIKIGIFLDVMSILLLCTSGLKFEIALSFALILLAINILCYYLLKLEVKVSIASCSLLVFSYLFFYISPLIQIRKSDYSELINTFPISENLIINGNILISISILTYLLIYKSLDRNICIKSHEAVRLDCINPFFLLKMSCLLILPFVLVNSYELVQYFNNNGAYQNYNSITLILLTKFVYFIPIAIAAFFIEVYGIKKHFRYLIPILILAILFKNPFIENRSGFGVAYLFLLFICAQNLLSSNTRIIILLFTSMTILFPLGEILSIYRNIHIDPFTKFITVFNTVHYDAWANGIATLDMVKKYGFTEGNQILGALLFFIPRDFWVSKPIASGQMLGEYMVENYHHWMTNISMPYVFEAYLDFGLPGVILFSAAFAIIVFFLDAYYESKNIFIRIISIYISVSTIFILRGPLLSSYAYTFGGVLSLIFTYWLIWFTIKKGKNNHI